jgi:hypothetical protein
MIEKIKIPEKSIIVIPKGTRIISTHPTKSDMITTRMQKITISSISSHSGEINWIGAGNYWRWCYPSDEIIEANPEFKEELIKAKNKFIKYKFEYKKYANQPLKC